jgi:hypothetical protein
VAVRYLRGVVRPSLNRPQRILPVKDPDVPGLGRRHATHGPHQVNLVRLPGRGQERHPDSSGVRLPLRLLHEQREPRRFPDYVTAPGSEKDLSTEGFAAAKISTVRSAANSTHERLISKNGQDHERQVSEMSLLDTVELVALR